MLKYFLYCRKSSEAEDRQIHSIESQVNELKRYSEKRKFQIVAVLTEAKSAKAPGRPVFNSMMQRLYRVEADGISAGSSTVWRGTLWMVVRSSGP